MNTLRRSMLALALGGAMLGVIGLAVPAAPASATLPPGWTPGTYYNNIFNVGNVNPLPKTGPVSRAAPVVVVPAPAPQVGGQYCGDASGGTLWVPSGAPTDGLTCPAPDPGS